MKAAQSDRKRRSKSFAWRLVLGIVKMCSPFLRFSPIFPLLRRTPTEYTREYIGLEEEIPSDFKPPTISASIRYRFLSKNAAQSEFLRQADVFFFFFSLPETELQRKLAKAVTCVLCDYLKCFKFVQVCNFSSPCGHIKTTEVCISPYKPQTL